MDSCEASSVCVDEVGAGVSLNEVETDLACVTSNCCCCEIEGVPGGAATEST